MQICFSVFFILCAFSEHMIKVFYRRRRIRQKPLSVQGITAILMWFAIRNTEYAKSILACMVIGDHTKNISVSRENAKNILSRVENMPVDIKMSLSRRIFANSKNNSIIPLFLCASLKLL
jgi:hypothetical protein